MEMPVVVDMQKLQTDDKELHKLKEACKRLGCFRVINHSIPATLMAEMKAAAKYLHDLPQDTKRRNASVIPDSGYVPSTEASPLYEGLGIYDMHASPQAVHDFCAQLDLPPFIRQIIESYGHAIHELASSISQKMAESLGVEGTDFKDWPFIFRIIKYDFTPQGVGKMGVPLHSDTGFVTLLQDDDKVGGLEMMDDSGSFWEVPPKAGSFLCIIGDVAHAWSNGRFRNMKHRVLCKETVTRFSFGAFMLASRDGKVDAPTELVDKEHPRLFRPFSYEDLRIFRIQTGKRAGEVLDQFRIAN